MSEALLLGMMSLLVVAFYIPFAVITVRRMQARTGRGRFYRGVTSILKDCSNDSECVPQIQTLYKRLSERYGLLAEEFRSATDMIEDLVCSLDTLEEKRFKRLFGIDPPIQTRTRIVNTLNVMKESQPFSSLSSKESNLLNMLKHAIERGNPDLAKSGLHQLADEIEVLEGSLRTQSKRTQLSFVISAIGVVLTLFFGAISFVQLAKS